MEPKRLRFLKECIPAREEHPMSEPSEAGNVHLSRRDFMIASSVAAIASGSAATPAEPASAVPPRIVTVPFTVNGTAVVAQVEARVTLLDYLRDRLQLTGTKKGCNEGACGTCTVLVDGKRMNGCLTLVVQCEGRRVTTIEGIAPGD